MDIHETNEMVHHAAHGRHGDEGGGVSKNNKRIAVLISVLACLLAMVEIGGSSAQNKSLIANIEASNLWAFFQAKTVRMTVTRSAAELLEAMISDDLSAERAAAWKKQIADFRASSQHFDSDPDKGEGRKELMIKAKAAEDVYKHSLQAYHLFEYSSGAMQIGIVLASASAATGVIVLAYLASGLATIGILIGALAWLAPTALHL